MAAIHLDLARVMPAALPGISVGRIVAADGLVLDVEGLDAIDGTPVLDITPVMHGFLPRGAIREPDRARAIMAGYW